MVRETIVSLRPAEDGQLAALTPTGLVSVLVPCCGGLEYTRLCVPALLKNSRPPFELVFLDAGSLDGTAEYLAGVRATAQVRVEVVRADSDLGIPDAVKEAVGRAHGEFLALVNNDTVVPQGWLEQLTALARLSPAIGLVGPMSNYAAPPQLVEHIPYRVNPRRAGRLGSSLPAESQLVDAGAVQAFAQEHQRSHQGKWLEAERLGGFCLLVKRSVLDRVGDLGETGLGLFDTDALSLRARRAGFTLACCRDLFVHHFGTRTFAQGAPSSSAAVQPH